MNSGTFYLDADGETSIERPVQKLLAQDHGMHRVKSMVGATIVFIMLNASLAANMHRSPSAQFMNLIGGESKRLMTNKAALHMALAGKGFLFPTIVLPHQADHIDAFLQRGPHMKILKPTKGWGGQGIVRLDTHQDPVPDVWRGPPSGGVKAPWLLQDYLERPALVRGHKFHMRVALLVVCHAGQEPRIFVGTQHVIVPAQKPYQQDKAAGHEYDAVHDTHAKTATQFHYFPEVLADGWEGPEKPQRQIRRVLRDVIRKVGMEFGPDWGARNGWEVFGCDFMWDTKGKVYLLEINARVGVANVNAYMFTEALKLAVFGQQTDMYEPLMC